VRPGDRPTPRPDLTPKPGPGPAGLLAPGGRPSGSRSRPGRGPPGPGPGGGPLGRAIRLLAKRANAPRGGIPAPLPGRRRRPGRRLRAGLLRVPSPPRPGRVAAVARLPAALPGAGRQAPEETRLRAAAEPAARAERGQRGIDGAGTAPPTALAAAGPARPPRLPAAEVARRRHLPPGLAGPQPPRPRLLRRQGHPPAPPPPPRPPP